jgi:hypothetical protein
MTDLVWHRRLAEVPGVGYEPILPVDRVSLPRRDHEPRRLPRVDLVQWFGAASPGEYGDPAPVLAHIDRGYKLLPDVYLRTAVEALELPGTTADYHLALCTILEQLETHLPGESFLAAILTLADVDIRLCRASPGLLHFSDEDLPRGGVSALYRLSLAEGFVDDASALIDMAEGLAGPDDRRTGLVLERERLRSRSGAVMQEREA